MRFYLGTHEPTWLNKAHVPLFVSYLRLKERCKRKLPRARVPWALDGSGFSVLNKYHRYPWPAGEYAADVRQYEREIGNLDWAAVQDWMCEKEVLALTGLTVEEHQRRTVQSWLDLKRLAPEVWWVPVLQGYTRREYLRCAEMYADAGLDLTKLLVGIGSICRREDTTEAEGIIRELAAKGLKLHGFGFKLGGLERCADVLYSADSLAWSDAARHRVNAAKRAAKSKARQPSLFEAEEEAAEILTRYHSPQNSPRFALDWLDDVEVRAGMKEDRYLMHPCPFCGSNDVHPPMSSELDYSCVECGESWGDIREPSLRGGLSSAQRERLDTLLPRSA